MRRDPIIEEDWTVGTTNYFRLSSYVMIDFILSLAIAIVGIAFSIISSAYIYIFIWTFSIPIVFYIEYVIDQHSRTISNRILLFAVFIVLSYLTITPQVGNWQYLLAILLGLKLINAPVQNFFLQFYSDILIPNNDDVEMVLGEHLARLQESSYRVETDEEFQSRIFAVSKQILSILGPALLLAVVISLLLSQDTEIINYLKLGILVIPSLSFTYVLIVWYLDQKLRNREKKISRDIGDDAVFPEMVD